MNASFTSKTGLVMFLCATKRCDKNGDECLNVFVRKSQIRQRTFTVALFQQHDSKLPPFAIMLSQLLIHVSLHALKWPLQAFF